MNTYIINAIGLFLDIIGAWLVAIEVLYQFKGKKLSGENATWDDPASEETTEYKSWEKSKYIKMKFGLAFLTIGFSLQILSNGINYFSPPDKNINTQIIINDATNMNTPVITKKEPGESPENIITKPDVKNESQNAPLKDQKPVKEEK